MSPIPDGFVVADSGERIEVRWCELPIAGDRRYGILVPLDDCDEIAEALLAGTYVFPQHYSLLFQLTPAGGRVLDLGAHLGTFSILAAAHRYSVLAVEASPRNIAVLGATIERNGIRNLTATPGVVSDSNDSSVFVQSGPHGYVVRGSAPPDASAIAVTGIRVDDLLAQYGWSEVDFVKMDIEGSEATAIGGMPRLLDRNDAPVILFESNGHMLRFYGLTPADLRSRFEAYGYRCYQVRPRQLVPTTLHEVQTECVVDYVAAKQLPWELGEWNASAGWTVESRAWLALAACTHWHPHHRAHAGRALRSADQAFLKDWRIAKALNTLKTDPDRDVRQAVEWWSRDYFVPFRAIMQFPRITWHRGMDTVDRLWSRLTR